MASIREICLPASLYTVSPYAFVECPNLKFVRIPEGISKIGQKAFFRCGNLSYVSLPNGLRKIDEQAFADCTGLVDVLIPSSVIEIGKDVFGETYKFTSGVPIIMQQMKITIRCDQGTVAQDYARANGLALERCEQYADSVELNQAVYLVKRNDFSKKLKTLQNAEEDIVRECGLSTVDELYYEKADSWVFQSGDPMVADKMHGQSSLYDPYMLSEV